MLTRKQHELLMFIDRHLRETGFSPSFDEMKDALNLRSKSGIHRLISALEERGFLSRRHHRARALEVVRMPDYDTPRPRASVLPTMTELRERGLGASYDPLPGTQRPADITPAPVRLPEPALEAASFTPNVIRGDFSSRLPGVRVAEQASAIAVPLYGRIAAGQPIEALRDSGSQIEVPIALLGNGEHYALEVAGDSMIEAGILDGDTVLIRKEEASENGQIVVALIDDSEVTLKRLRRRGAAIALEPANPNYEIRVIPADRVRVQGRLVGLLRRY
ncbi:repressor LexA [Endobacter medicaginis]|jgi:repressor LexA|uniref:LexA repressor n=1 Tax=Endobacter medicaginis TaxID=1181271 RepID=A0A850NKC9_9PROT|nr:transcriptional repressor LexA [Endobacter medicaginis]MBB3172755.1 repressor LexA [Endobacter medicaginis]MCX5474362.1 transcriptional repressor LexA [Endobacter medicaginis]NVN29374.1 transcriptional repressor LexA [Endobacter medicaginis]